MPQSGTRNQILERNMKLGGLGGYTALTPPNAPDSAPVRAGRILVPKKTSKTQERCALLEREVEKHFCDKAKARGGMAVKLSDDQMAGLPDRLILLPDGKVAFVEFKAPGKKPRALQLHRMKQLQQLGFQTFVVDGKGLAEGVLDAIHTA